VVLTGDTNTLRTHVTITVGRPGLDHDAVEHLATTGTLAAVSARHPKAAASVASVLDKMITKLPARPC
jgi:transketolase